MTCWRNDLLAYLRQSSLLEPFRRAERLVVSLAAFRRFVWVAANKPGTLRSRNLFRLPGAKNDDALPSVGFNHAREIHIVLDGRDKGFRDVMQLQALESSNSAMYQKIYRFARGGNRRYHKRMQKYLVSPNWQLQYAKGVLESLAKKMWKALKIWPHHTAPTITVWYPGEGANFVVTDRGDLDNEGEFPKDGEGKPWATFTWPTVKIEYPDRFEMKSLPSYHVRSGNPTRAVLRL